MEAKQYVINNNGGLYINGLNYNPDQKIQVVLEYYEVMEEGATITCRSLAKQAKVGRSYASKIINDIQNGSLSFGPTERDNIPQGAGSKTLTPPDELVLLSVYYQNPKAILAQYQWKLFQTSGKFVSRSTISRWLRSRFPHKMTLCKTNHVPIDKYKPENAIRVHEYLLTISCLLSEIHRVKFGDEKPLKSAELFNSKARRDPITGMIPPTIVNSNFRNVYNIVGFCGIDIYAKPVDYYILDTKEHTTTAAVFMHVVQKSIAKGF